MKKLLIICLFAPCFTQAQTLPELIAEYENYCNELVPDTVLQEGLINYDLVPVMRFGEIVNYAFANSDTVWQKVKCPEFKDSDRLSFTRYRITNNWEGETTPLHIEAMSKFRITEKTTRLHICTVKRREPRPWSEDFWNWLKAYKKD